MAEPKQRKSRADVERSSRRTGARAPDVFDASGAKYRQMLEVLTQFRVVISNLKTHYREVEAVTGVGGAQLWALTAIGAHPGIQVGELARELAIHPSTASNLVDRLVMLGHLRRVREEGDLRAVMLHLTPSGKDITRRAPQPALGPLQHALLAMPEDTVNDLKRNLAMLIEAIGLSRTKGHATPLSVLLEDSRSASQSTAAKRKARA